MEYLALDGTPRSTQVGDFINASWLPSRTPASLRIGLERKECDVVAWIENLTGDDMLERIVPSSSTNPAGSVLFAYRGVNTTQRRCGLTFRLRS
jgi:hypothetical protein